MSNLHRQLFKAANSIPEDELIVTDNKQPETVNNLLRKSEEESVDWTLFFSQKRDIVTEDGSVFCIYETRATDETSEVARPFGSIRLSFALTVRELQKQTNNQCSIVCYDCRGMVPQLTDDLVEITRRVHQHPKQSMILVGHSMGGAVVVDAVSRVVVLDVSKVCSAMESLAYMSAFIQSRPVAFDNLDDAIQWSVRSGGVHNIKSARISVPPLLYLHTDEQGRTMWKWRTNLAPTKPYWKEWFHELSSKFLACPTARLLILAGADRLDNPLIIGQMQGKFQLIVFNQSGHHIQEDVPDRLAQALVEFQHRNQALNLPIKRFPIPVTKNSTHDNTESK
ncbi:hypothetical protein BDF22DRAFT_684810 [Syncephalis plumigaleata]|nr:hypothetical protein BDF22DRAFT_684810 [Syncephalis plumigaleata]